MDALEQTPALHLGAPSGPAPAAAPSRRSPRVSSAHSARAPVAPRTLPAPASSSPLGTVLFRRERAPARAVHRVRVLMIACVAFALPALTVAVASANARPVDVDLLLGRTSVPLPWLIEITVALGWLSGVLTTKLLRRRSIFGGPR